MYIMKVSLIGIFLLTLPHTSFAVEAPSLELGKALFESPDLGNKQRSCETCHAQGQGLEKTGDFSDEELKDIINACIRDALGGKLLDLDAQELNALLGYVRLFQKN